MSSVMTAKSDATARGRVIPRRVMNSTTGSSRNASTPATAKGISSG